MAGLQGARAAEEAGPSSSGQGFFSTTTDRSRQPQGGISQYAPQKDVRRLAKRQALLRIAAGASVGTGRWHEGSGGSSGIYGTPVIGGGGSGSRSRTSHVVGGFESDTDRARRERTEKQQQVQQQEQDQRAAAVEELAARMQENEDADLADNPEVSETIMADMSSNWEVPTPDEVPEDVVANDEAGGAATDATAEKSTGTIAGEWAVGQDHRNKQEGGNPQATASAAASSPPATSSAATDEKPKSQGTMAGEWAVGADHKTKQSRRPPSGGRGFES